MDVSDELPDRCTTCVVTSASGLAGIDDAETPGISLHVQDNPDAPLEERVLFHLETITALPLRQIALTSALHRQFDRRIE
jgi:hypothetical protein